MSTAERWSVHPPLRFVDGAPYSTLFDDVFKSRFGALEESEQVFLRGSAIRERWRGKTQHTLLELGFGLGVNFLCTLLAWRADPQRCARLEYVSIEKHPLSAPDLQRALDWLASSGRAELVGAGGELRALWPPLSRGIHRLRFDAGAFTLLLVVDDAAACVPHLQLAADTIYLDGFSPSRDGRMWQPSVFKGLARLSRRGARLASYSSAPQVRDGLAAAGFQVTRAPGFAPKRRSLQAVYEPAWRTFAEPPPRPDPAVRRAAVIGAGLAGCAVARGLAGRGWQVTVFEAAAGIAAGGSSQPTGSEHPHASADDNLLARLTRAAWGLSRSDPGWRVQGGDGRDGFESVFQRRGKLLLATSEEAAAAQRRAVAGSALPDRYVRAVDRGQALQLAGWDWLRNSPALHGALWFGDAMTLSPRALCRHWLGAQPDAGATSFEAGDANEVSEHATGITLRTGTPVRRLERSADDAAGWRLVGDDELLLAEAPVVVVANAADAATLLRLDSIRLTVRAGQTSVVRSTLGAPNCALGGDAYLCPIDAERFLVGATFEQPGRMMPPEAADASNLQRLAATLGIALPEQAWRVEHRGAGVRCATPDRLPVIGTVPDEAAALAQRTQLLANVKLPLPTLPGLYASFAHGARGLLWSVLGAEVIVARVAGDAMPLSAELSAAVDPGRYLRRWLRPAGD